MGSFVANTFRALWNVSHTTFGTASEVHDKIRTLLKIMCHRPVWGHVQHLAERWKLFASPRLPMNMAKPRFPRYIIPVTDANDGSMHIISPPPSQYALASPAIDGRIGGISGLLRRVGLPSHFSGSDWLLNIHGGGNWLVNPSCAKIREWDDPLKGEVRNISRVRNYPCCLVWTVHYIHSLRTSFL